jgi:hypothetical protein
MTWDEVLQGCGAMLPQKVDAAAGVRVLHNAEEIAEELARLILPRIRTVVEWYLACVGITEDFTNRTFVRLYGH